MDFVAPALVGLGFYLIYEAWQSHTSGKTPTPLADIRAALGGASPGGPDTVAGAAPESPANAAAPSSGGSSFGGSSGAIHP